MSWVFMTCAVVSGAAAIFMAAEREPWEAATWVFGGCAAAAVVLRLTGL